MINYLLEKADWYYYKLFLMQKEKIFNPKGESGRVMIHYKTDAFVPKLINRNWRHSNRQEIKAMVDSFVKKDYTVVVVDTQNKKYKPKDNFCLYLGLAAGNSGARFLTYCQWLPRAIKVAYCAGPDPILSNQLVEKMYSSHNARTNRRDPSMRTITKIDFRQIAEHCDAIICIGEKNMFSYHTYTKYNKPIYGLPPSLNPCIKIAKRANKIKNKKSFVCFAGSGFICKGVHILVEAFMKNPHLELHICGPNDEPAFWDAYGRKIKSTKNIYYHGLVKPGSKQYQAIVSKCAYNILYSAAEGCATSVLNVMASETVPILNFRCGLNNKLFPIQLADDVEDEVSQVSYKINKAEKISDKEYSVALAQTLIYANNFTLDAFERSFGLIIRDLLND